MRASDERERLLEGIQHPQGRVHHLPLPQLLAGSVVCNRCIAGTGSFPSPIINIKPSAMEQDVFQIEGCIPKGNSGAPKLLRNSLLIVASLV